MTPAHVAVTAVALGCVIQGTYIYARDLLPLSPILAACTAALFTLSVSPFLREFRRFGIVSGLGLLLIVYVLALGVHFRGRGLAVYLLTPFSLMLFYALLCGLQARPGWVARLGELTPVVVGTVALVHVPAAALWLREFGYGLGFGWTAYRYGFRDGINLINLTGANLAIVFGAGYAFARLAPATRMRRGLTLAASLGLILPTFATQSRAAALMCATMIFLVEVRLLASARSARDLTSTFAVLLAGAMAAAYVVVAYWDSLLGAVFGSLTTRLTQTVTEGDALRSDALRAALDVANPLFGAFRPATEVSFGARDNTFSNYVLSYGLIGFVLGTAFYVGAIWSLGRTLGRSRWFLPLVVLPVLPRSLGEGSYITTSSIFCLLFLIAAVAVSTPRQPGREAQRPRPPAGLPQGAT